MSKSTLKKELNGLSHEQIIDVVLTAYSSNKAIKDYFDFFVNPDVDKLYQRFSSEISKEIIRGKYGRSTARISRIKKSIKSFESYNPGVERCRDLRLSTVEALIDREQSHEYSDTLINGTLKLLNDTLAYADKNLIIDSTIQKVDEILAVRNDRSKYFRKFLKNNLELPTEIK